MADPKMLSFEDCVWACWNHPEFMAQYRRLTGSKIGLGPKSVLEAMIDEVCRAPRLDPVEGRAFLRFVHDYVWTPLATERVSES